MLIQFLRRIGFIMKLFLIGRPRCGKTTLFLSIISALDIHPSGFYTEEIRKRGMRIGFRIRTFDGRQGVMATISEPKDHKIGKYYVDLETFEHIAMPTLATTAELYAIDEIGKMEMLSLKFRTALQRILDSDKNLIATVGLAFRDILPAESMAIDVKPERIDEIKDKVLKILKPG